MTQTPDSATLAKRLATAQHHHREGRLQEAENEYGEVLKRDPNNTEALYLAGMLAQQTRDAVKAITLLRRAAERAPGLAPIWLALANLHQSRNELADAARCLEAAVALQPDPRLWNNLGVVSKEMGLRVEAEQAFRKAIALQSAHPSACNNLGNICRDKGSLDEALLWFRQALACQPDYPEALNNLGLTLLVQSRLDEAEPPLRRALELRPDYANALRNLAAVCHGLARTDEAESLLVRAVESSPEDATNHRALAGLLHSMGRHDEAKASVRRADELLITGAEALSELGAWYSAQGMFEEAVRVLERAVRIDPVHAQAHSRLGSALAGLSRRVDAGKSYRRALELCPDFAEAEAGLGALYVGQREFVQAERHYRRAHELDQDGADALIGLLGTHRHLCLWDNLGDPPPEHLRSLLEHWARAASGLLVLLATPGATRADHRVVAEACARTRFRAPTLEEPLRLRDAIARQRLRVGYLSNDLHDHATSQLLVDVIERHDRSRFEVVAYAYSPDTINQSKLRQRIVAAFDTFHEVGGMSDETIAARIAADGIDILVDLKGYTYGSRSRILAMRPAPVQVNWLGYPGTLGDEMLADYLIGDATVTPLSEAADYGEKLALMPHCYQPNDRQREIGGKPSRTEAGLPDSGFVFCSFNQSFKLTSAVFAIWCRLLETVPDSVLWLPTYHPATQRNLWQTANQRGIAPERLVFAPFLPNAEHLGRLQLADLALDTSPYGSHTTGSDALWTGVPLVTCPGGTFASRVGASLVKAVGLPEMIAKDPEGYFELAVSLANDRDRLQTLRETLLANRATAPLFDSARFARDLGQLYESMWSNHLAGVHRAIAPPVAD